MPEYPDWAAVPQAAVSSFIIRQNATEAGVTVPGGLGVAGRSLVIVGLDLAGVPNVNPGYHFRDVVSAILVDHTTTEQRIYAAIAPDAPGYAPRPPFGSVILAVASDFDVILTTAVGSGSQAVGCVVSYYYQ